MKLIRLMKPALGSLVIVPLSIQAQEALRSAIQTDRALAPRPPTASQDTGGMRWGPVQMSLGVSLSVEYNDNIRPGSTINEPEDEIIRPQVDIGLLWPITQSSALTFGIGVGYEFYSDNSEYNSLLLTPDSALTYSVTIKDLVLSVYEQVDYSQDVISQVDTVVEDQYRRLNNTAGLRASWTIGDVQLTGSYSHYNFIAFDEEYSYLDRASEQFFVRGGYLFGPATSAGLESSISLTAYDEPEPGARESQREDFDSFSFGPYVEWAVVEGLAVTARGGYTIYAFDRVEGSALEDSLSSYYAQLAVTHELTEFISHSLSAVRDVSVGVDSDYTERVSINYNIRWQMTELIDVSTGAAYEWGQEADSPPPSGAPPGTPNTPGEEYDRVGFNLGGGMALTDHLRASLAYRFYRRWSNQDNGDYDNNVVTLTLGYRF